jgi:hypothetical protein
MNNTLFHNAAQISLRHGQTRMSFKNNDVHDNIAVSLTDGDYNVQGGSIENINGPTPITSWAYFHANKYARITPSSSFFMLGATNLNLTGSSGLWKSTYQMDWDSKELPLNFPLYTINRLIGSNLYTSGTILTQFATAALGSRVVASKPIGAVTAGKSYVTHFTMHAPDAEHQLLVFIQEDTPPYTHLTDVIKIPSGSPSTSNTVVFQKLATSYSKASLVFQIDAIDPRIYIDNIDLYEADVTPNDVNNNYVFKYNASKSVISVPLSGTYQDLNGVTYSGSVKVQPYASVILLKK